MDKLDPITEEGDAPSSDAITFTAEEIAGIEEALADVEAHGSIPLEEVEAWLDGLDTDNPRPEPQPEVVAIFARHQE